MMDSAAHVNDKTTIENSRRDPVSEDSPIGLSNFVDSASSCCNSVHLSTFALDFQLRSWD